VVPRMGERRAALMAIVIATIGYAGYGMATQGWMMFAWLSTWLFGAIVMPTTNGYMSRRVPHDAQGELQGAVAGMYSLSSIVGPPVMAQLFSRFSGARAPVHVPGAAFFAAALLTTGCFVLYWRATRAAGPIPEQVTQAPAAAEAQETSG